MIEYTVYLAGPISGLTYGECTGWREQVKNILPPHIQSLSPMRGKQRLEIAGDEVIKDSYENNPLTTAKGINIRDYNDVKRCDLLIVNMLGAKTVSIGTVMELAWARAFQKPVILVMEKEGNIHEHSFVNYCTGFRTESLHEAVALAEVILGPDKMLD